jgi:hypothetical protein
MISLATGIASLPLADAPAAQALATCVAAETGRRLLPPLTAVPVVMGEEPWREPPRLRAMNLSRACSRVVHATVPGVHLGVLAACPHRVSLRVQNAAQISCTIVGRITSYFVVRTRACTVKDRCSRRPQHVPVRPEFGRLLIRWLLYTGGTMTTLARVTFVDTGFLFAWCH